MNLPGHNADLAFTWRNNARAIGADQARRFAGKESRRAHHVESGNAFSDGDDEGKTRVRSFHDGVSGERRRHEDDGGVCARPIHGFLDGVEYRDTFDAGPAFARSYARNNFRAVSYGLLSVEHAFAAGDALHD